MSKKCDALAKIRVSAENQKWLEEYRTVLGINASIGTLANMLMDAGRKHISIDKLKAALRRDFGVRG